MKTVNIETPNYKHRTKTSLQAYPAKHCNNPLLFMQSMINSKRTSSFSFCKSEGSITIEAALAIPMFLFFIINLLSLILVFGEYTNNLGILHQRGKELSVYAHSIGDNGGLTGDMISLTKTVKIQPIIPIIAFPTSRTMVNCQIRKWTGYDVVHGGKTEDVEEWVYITPSGSVYHRKRSCSYLNPSLQCGSSHTIEGMRNRSGEKYYACERCGKGAFGGIVYYTNYGNRYHGSLTCGSLKRTVESVPISKVNGRHGCSKCS